MTETAAGAATPISPPHGEPPVTSLRASDSERAAVVGRLHAALGEGRLDLDEVEARTATAYVARYRSDLTSLLADLPEDEPERPAAGWAPLGTAVVRQVWVATSGLRGATPTDPDASQRRATAVVMVVAAIWTIAFLLVGFTVALTG